MKQYLSVLMATALVAAVLPSNAQLGGPSVPQFGDGMEKLFGSNQTFSAETQIQASNGNNPMTMSGKMYFDKGNSRFEMDLSQMQGASFPPQAMAQMKTMGLDKMVSITQSNKKILYLVYPDAQVYTEMTPATPDTSATNAEAAPQITAEGNETVAGHPCVKNKVVVTDKQGVQHEFTVWDATDLKNFPIQIAMNAEDNAVTFTFQNVSFTTPDPSLFLPPTGFTKYDSMQDMMQAVMMKNLPAGTMPGGGGLPPPSQ